MLCSKALNLRLVMKHLSVPKKRSFPVQDIFCYGEWLTIVAFLLVLVLQPKTPAQFANFFAPQWVGYAVLSGLSALSCVFPGQWKLWQRYGYVLVSFGLMLIGIAAGYDFDVLFYLLIAKCCFLFTRRHLIVLLVGMGILWNGAVIWLVQRSRLLLEANATELLKDTQGYILPTIVGSVAIYIAICAFLILLSFTLLREQKIRSQAEKLAAEVEILAATVERSRIAREIHDSLGHRLTTLDVQLELAQKLKDRDPERASQSIDIAKQLASQCLQDVRHAVHSMGNQVFDLNVAIQTLVQPLDSNPEVKLNYSTQFPPLPATLSHQIYCIIQEGLTNIQRHGKASQIWLQGKRVGDIIRVELRDNGVGFNLDRAPSGFGLRGMSERAQLVGGHLEIYSDPGAGTSLCFEVPVPVVEL
jgi:signal transduction histidine kinase